MNNHHDDWVLEMWADDLLEEVRDQDGRVRTVTLEPEGTLHAFLYDEERTACDKTIGAWKYGYYETIYLADFAFYTNDGDEIFVNRCDKCLKLLDAAKRCDLSLREYIVLGREELKRMESWNNTVKQIA